MKFLDEAKVYIKSGNGGNGCVSFRREKFIEFGGPDGGDGGKGGDVIAVCVDNLNTLIDYKYQQHFKAKNGTPGMGQKKHGKKGKDIILPCPPGTIIVDQETQQSLVDLVTLGQKFTIAQGGNGGHGNVRFKSSTNQAPRHANKGQPGIAKTILLKLKTIADIGIIGLPNAGKSTLLATISSAKPKIASYPFTTIYPNLGVIKYEDEYLNYEQMKITLADIPGLIENAHQGQGLGDRFLKHIERCPIILHLIACTDNNIIKSYNTIRNELKQYQPNVGKKTEIIVLTKIDLLNESEITKKISEISEITDKKIYTISSVSKQGIETLITAMIKSINFFAKEIIKRQN